VCPTVFVVVRRPDFENPSLRIAAAENQSEDSIRHGFTQRELRPHPKWKEREFFTTECTEDTEKEQILGMRISNRA
jgi:hypothetical protein